MIMLIIRIMVKGLQCASLYKAIRLKVKNFENNFFFNDTLKYDIEKQNLNWKNLD